MHAEYGYFHTLLNSITYAAKMIGLPLPYRWQITWMIEPNQLWNVELKVTCLKQIVWGNTKLGWRSLTSGVMVKTMKKHGIEAALLSKD